MKKIGILGGIGPESTVDYYRQIIGAFQKQNAGLSYPEIIIYSADLGALLMLVESNRWDQMADWLVERVGLLHQAGAEFAVIASNTPHAVFDQVQARSPIPMLSIVTQTCQKARELGLKRLGLLGTRFTMTADFYPQAFAKEGMTIITPAPEERELIQQRIFSEIELGIVKDSTRQELLAIVQRMMTAGNINAIILGCTELPLILDQDYFGIPFLNTTAIHAQSIVRYCLQ